MLAIISTIHKESKYKCTVRVCICLSTSGVHEDEIIELGLYEIIEFGIV